MAEVYAAFLAYDDHNIGRVIDAVTQEGLADNTLIIFIEGDNGGSAEGTLQGTANEIATICNRSPETFDYLYSIKDELGGPLYYNHMPVPWSGPSTRRSNGRSATPAISAAPAMAW